MNNRECRFGNALSFSFDIKHAESDSLARVGTINTPHGPIQTPAFIPVGTKATVKSVLPEAMADLGAQALLSNAYHLYLQPGSDILDEAGRIHELAWPDLYRLWWISSFVIGSWL
jgi:queuine tRNA-ribosyltransferase